MNRHARLISGIAVVCLLPFTSGMGALETPGLEPVLQSMLQGNRSVSQYNYVLTGRIKLLLFWIGRDDVGGGYIRRAERPNDPELRILQVLFGSDPSKAPRRINHWGAATEAVKGNSTMLLGFMTSAETGSAAGAEAEIRRQREAGQFTFQALISLIDKDHAMSRSVNLFSPRSLSLNELTEAEKIVADRLGKGSPIRQLTPANRQCTASRGFLRAVDELIGQTLALTKVPQPVCYIHNARNYTLTLQERSTVRAKEIVVDRKDGKKMARSYRDLIHTRFLVLNHESKERTTFELLLGTAGELRGVPVQIVHQPNWWFQAVLNLVDVEGSTGTRQDTAPLPIAIRDR